MVRFILLYPRAGLERIADKNSTSHYEHLT